MSKNDLSYKDTKDVLNSNRRIPKAPLYKVGVT